MWIKRLGKVLKKSLKSIFKSKINPDSSAEQNAKVYEEWTSENIIKAFELLGKYDALYYFKSDTNGYKNLNYSYLLDYLYSITIGYDNLRRGSYYLPFNDLFEPYYPVFEWLSTKGFLSYGT